MDTEHREYTTEEIEEFENDTTDDDIKQEFDVMESRHPCEHGK